MNKERKPFNFKNFTINQEGASLPVTTDACLFGALAEFEHPQKILDLGTGTGLLLHFMAQKYPEATLWGIDFHNESVSCARKNFHQNEKSLELTNRYHLLEGDFFKPNSILDFSNFDAIISNPPFFENQLKSKNLVKSKARHFENGEMRKFFILVNKLLSDDGTAIILLPTEQIIDLSNLNLFNIKTIFIHSNPSKKAHLQILFLRKTEFPKIEETMVIRDLSNQYTEQFCKKMSPFYLEQAFSSNQ